MSNVRTAYLRMPAHLSRLARHVAIEQGITLNDVIVEALRRYLATSDFADLAALTRKAET